MLFSFLGIYLIASIILVVFYLIPHFNQVKVDSWFEDELEDIAISNLQQIVGNKNKVIVRRYVYTNYDKKIAEANRSRDEKEYPFAKVAIYAEIDRSEYILYFSKNATGDLILDKHEKTDKLVVDFYN